MDIQFLDTTDHMVYGHEGWLDISSPPASEDGRRTLTFNWGHNMESHGLARRQGLSTRVVMPDGSQQDLLISHQTPERYLFDFTPQTKGIYHFINENTGYYVIDRDGHYLAGTLKEYPDVPNATFYRQFSHTCLMTGKPQAGEQVFAMPPLPFSLVPLQWKPWQVGETLVFSLHMENKKLAETPIDLAHTTGSGNRVSHKELATDRDGNLELTIKEPGRYLLIARHRTPDGKAGLYYDTSLTYTFFFCID